MVIFSGHDSNLAYLLSVLLDEDIVKNLRINYGSYFIFELHFSKKINNFYIKFSYDNK